jgi:hypothetical protein
MDTVETLVDVPANLNKEIRSLDEIFDICSLDDYYHGEPEPEDMDRILSMCDAVDGLFDEKRIASIRKSSKKLKT